MSNIDTLFEQQAVCSAAAAQLYAVESRLPSKFREGNFYIAAGFVAIVQAKFASGCTFPTRRTHEVAEDTLLAQQMPLEITNAWLADDSRQARQSFSSCWHVDLVPKDVGRSFGYNSRPGFRQLVDLERFNQAVLASATIGRPPVPPQ